MLRQSKIPRYQEATLPVNPKLTGSQLGVRVYGLGLKVLGFNLTASHHLSDKSPPSNRSGPKRKLIQQIGYCNREN